ncbi:hypothetical protein [Shewanella sp. MEBiC00475]|uniref:hypothetical protein n=1 Tax=Shewanella sp. MEBiC00475 TaxID=2575361 RepID=UPI0010BF8DFD|nr:hypothetical protein [Shewanella sp. MEBiC00475]
MLVQVVKGISEFSINLKTLSCSYCDITYSNQPVAWLSWMCPHITLAISENESVFKNIHPQFTPFVPVIKQHAQSNTDCNMANIDKVFNCDEVTLFTNQYRAENRDHEFLRVYINGSIYTIWLPEMQWCFNGDMGETPLSDNDKSIAEKHVFENIKTGLFYNLRNIELKTPEITECTKINKKGLRFVGESTGKSFKVTVNYKQPLDKIRLNLSISGWHNIRGSKVVYYDAEKHILKFNHRALVIFEKALLDWCEMISIIYEKVSKKSN